MATEIKIPRVGMAVTDATIIEWQAKEGEWVEEGQVVVIIETEKVRSDVESPAAGFLHILLKEGETAPAGKVIGLLAETKEELEALQKGAPAEISAKTEEPTTAAAASAAPMAETTSPTKTAVPPRGEERIKISPVARKLAEEHAIDITTVTGTGPGGRITREDIEKAIAAKAAAPAPAPEVAAFPQGQVKTTIPLKGMRGAIAEHMHRSLSVAAQLTAMGEIDMTEMVKLRNEFLEREKVIGARITYTDLLVFAIARVLREHPMLNASIIDNEIKVWEDINIGVAVALDEGLIVPVVRNADQKSLVEISQTVRALAEKAREGKLKPEEARGSTFTLTNLGALGAGWTFETAIINQPESAILRVGGITERAVVREGQIVIRPIMTYSLTYDHRVIDGAVAAKFISSLISTLENPTLLLA
ncbi:MAG TPA: 2-oxo acid dehydrogenase subunit E2 [Dehalococcoidia bacterium]|jgi:pyruvate dehydrogenase E2 component (dihydrolipoamide acetyltransferase)/2-oxoglutarate dehydrogenase E2 component (dihydrolipoamide succinyltransferase)|nr:2-oxo acid dehydrogenase subunit E2 [Dehalococcoidia bacterium]